MSSSRVPCNGSATSAMDDDIYYGRIEGRRNGYGRLGYLCNGRRHLQPDTGTERRLRRTGTTPRRSVATTAAKTRIKTAGNWATIVGQLRLSSMGMLD